MSDNDSDTQSDDDKYLHFVKLLTFDLKSPLTTIKGFSTLLLQEEFGPLQESQQQAVQKINLHADRINKMLEMYTKLAKIESGVLRDKQEPVDLASILNNIANNLPELESNYLTLQVNMPDNLPDVKARFYEVYEIVSGLIGNSITNSLPEAKISVVLVSDTNYVRTIINSSSVKPSLEIEAEGRDSFEFMELKIIQQYIEQFGGEFGEESEEGKGSTVWFTLPIADESAET